MPWQSNRSCVDGLNNRFSEKYVLYWYHQDPSDSLGRTFVVKWTGLKMAQDVDILFAQWVVIDKHDSEGLRVYAASPGSQGRYRRGEVFDTSYSKNGSVTGEDIITNPEAAYIKAEHLLHDTYERLCKEATRHGVYNLPARIPRK